MESKELVKAESAVPSKPVRNSRELAKLKKRLELQYHPQILESFLMQLLEGVKGGDEKKMGLAAKVLKLIQSEGGMSVSVQQNNNQVNVSPTRDRTAEAIIRRLEERKFAARKESEPEPIDAYFEDVG